MTGGLLQMASKGEADKQLVVTPQITFFRLVFRRHTHFAIEYVTEQFEGEAAFGRSLSLSLPKIGDLLHKTYLKIELPEVTLPYSSTGDPASLLQALKQAQTAYDQFKAFLTTTKRVYRDLHNEIQTYGVTFNDVETMLTTKVVEYSYETACNQFTVKLPTSEYTLFRLLPLSTRGDQGSASQHDLVRYLDIVGIFEQAFPATKYRNAVQLSEVFVSEAKSFLQAYLHQARTIDKLLFGQLSDKRLAHTEAIKSSQNFSYAAYLGHQLINSVEIEIGGKVIDRLDKHVLTMMLGLHSLPYKTEQYNKMVGNVPQLLVTDAATKPRYTLVVPLSFWFCRSVGQSLPLVFLRYHDVRINVTLEDMGRCCYADAPQAVSVIQPVSVSMLSQVFFLSGAERRKFAEIQHEYLIDQMQLLTLPNQTARQATMELDFFNPVKALYWIVINEQHEKLNVQLDYSTSMYFRVMQVSAVEDQASIREATPYLQGGLTSITLDKDVSLFVSVGDRIDILHSRLYGGMERRVVRVLANTLIINHTFRGNDRGLVRLPLRGNPVSGAVFDIDGVQRFSKRDGTTFGCIQPGQHFPATPPPGVNVYSFALVPSDMQPSGFCNFNRLRSKILTIDLDDQYIKKIHEHGEAFRIMVYAQSYNILKFESGKAHLALNL